MIRTKNTKYPFLAGGYKIVVVVTTLVLSAVLYSATNAAASELVEDADPFMGDWQGSWTMAEGTGEGSGPLVAQVIALGKGEYRLNLLNQFDARISPIAVVEGRREDTEVRFAGQIEQEGAKSDVRAIIKDGKLTGSLKGHNNDGKYVSVDFTLEKTVRLSPRLGAKPPEGAIVLFDGSDFEKWQHMSSFAGLIGIAEFVGSYDNAAAYLRSTVWSNKKQQAVLELGSDDGVKVWLNGELVHASNVGRALKKGEDKKEVALKSEWNELMLKVTNGSGGWEACVRLVNNEGELLEGVREMVYPWSSDTGTDRYYKNNDGFLTLWEITGPYRHEGKDFRAIFDVVFEPEKPDAQHVPREIIDLNKRAPDEGVRWKLVDGAMEVVPGAGSIVTKRKFRDFELHLEFRTSFMPESRGQGRSNSGVYLQGRYEVQILDSYGLEGLDNECGGIYKVGAPLVNMCSPPMQWQSYDITFRAPRFDTSGHKVRDARVTVVHNGVKVQENIAVPGPTGSAPDSNVTEPGFIYLQDHGNRVQYRNIWLIESP